MNCKIIVNVESGNCKRANVDKIKRQVPADSYDVQYVKGDWQAEGFDCVVACGGDGTLSAALNRCRGQKLFYLPCGTLNECASQRTIDSACLVNGRYFSYVCATGSFTEIGYAAKTEDKRRWKGLAYLPQAAKHYRCHDIPAAMCADGKSFCGRYTLIMILKSKRCFRFNFNKGYDKLPKSYLLAVKSVGKDCLKNRIKLFSPFSEYFFAAQSPPYTKIGCLSPLTAYAGNGKTPLLHRRRNGGAGRKTEFRHAAAGQPRDGAENVTSRKTAHGKTVGATSSDRLPEMQFRQIFCFFSRKSHVDFVKRYAVN